MNRQRSTARRGSGGADTLGAALSALWQTVPAGMRLSYFSRDTVPQRYRGGLGQRRGRPLGIDLSGLPEPMRTELAWCIFRIIEQAGKVDVTHTRMLARWLTDTVSDLGTRARSRWLNTGLAAADGIVGAATHRCPTRLGNGQGHARAAGPLPPGLTMWTLEAGSVGGSGGLG